ncbi:MAG: DNA polymerase III subunit gamma/tau [Anaerolineae bacterium]|nr:DNA polymerase III subunit gamma/tau [Anaerolineae bacterium]
MAVQALYRKWRPQTFDEVVGQEHVIRTLRNALTSGRVHHAYLFAGPRGTGKTTTARLLAKAVNCLAPEAQRPCNECAICQAVNEGRLLDLIEIDAASNTGVDDVRELREKVGFRPNEARYKVYVIDEVHMLSNAAFNALLKTLEEPPPHAIFVLATTESHKIPATVLSRCQRFDFRRIPVSQIVDRLAWMAEQEHIEADREALAMVARQATGSMRDAESLLDQLASFEEGGITADEVRAALGTGANEAVMQVGEALATGDVAQGLSVINTAIDEGADPRQFARQIVEHLRALLLLKLESGVVLVYISEDVRPQLEAQAADFSFRALTRAVRLFNQAAAEAKEGWQPQLPLEMAFIEAVQPAEAENPAPDRPSPPPRSNPSPPTRHSPSARTSSNPTTTTTTTHPASPATSRAPSAVKEPGPKYAGLDPGDGSLTPEVLRSQWPDFLNALRPRNLPLEALMRSCEPLAVEGDVVVLGFTHDFHRSRVEEDQNRQDIEQVLAELIGQRYRVRCVLSRQRTVGPPAPAKAEPTPSVDSTMIDDPVVRVAIDDLGAIVRQ